MLCAPRRQLRQRQGIGIDLAVNLIVAIITVSVNLLIAVGIGVLLASALFIYKMGRSVIHRKYTGENVHSKKVRNLAHQDALEKLGKQIFVFELKGPIFFGSADNLSMEIENSMQDAHYCILDMRRVSEIDSTGANILVQTHKMLAKEGKALLMTYLKDNRALWTFMEALNVTEILTEKQFFQDTDEALEAVEDLVLTQAGQLSHDQTGISLAQMDLVNGFSPDELDLLNAKLVSHRVSKGHAVLKEGDKSRDVYLLVKGSVSVRIRLSDNDRLKRLVSYSPGVMFGEMALLDGNPRSASVVADENTEVMKLSYDDFESLLREHPQVAAKLTQNIALVLAKRLRKLSDEIKMMELEAN
jgi:SulP family sulfate permease